LAVLSESVLAEMSSDCQAENQSINENETMEPISQSSKKDKAKRKKVCEFTKSHLGVLIILW
jgi:hypothetical protein